jgi:hypothetical protein
MSKKRKTKEVAPVPNPPTRELLPRRIEIPASVLFQVTRLSATMTTIPFAVDGDFYTRDHPEHAYEPRASFTAWSKLTTKQRRQIRKDFEGQIDSYSTWVDGDGDKVTFELDRSGYASEDLTQPPLVRYDGRFVFTPYDDMKSGLDIEEMNYSQKRCLIIGIVGDHFANYMDSAEDNVDLVGVWFRQPLAGLNLAWAAFDDAEARAKQKAENATARANALKQQTAKINAKSSNKRAPPPADAAPSDAVNSPAPKRVTRSSLTHPGGNK